MAEFKPFKVTHNGWFDIYYFNCVDCGSVFTKYRFDGRTKHYCADCTRKYEKLKAKERAIRKEAEIRAKAISEFAEKLKEELRDSIISDEEKFKYERRMQERICAQNVTFKVIIKLVEKLAEQVKESE